MTDADGILPELQACEARFHCPQADTTRGELQAMIADGFFEIGASGRRYDRRHALEVLRQRRGDPEPGAWRASEAACRPLGPSTWLLTYTLDQGGRLTRRATIWQHTALGWSALYHQGTRVQDA